MSLKQTLWLYLQLCQLNGKNPLIVCNQFMFKHRRCAYPWIVTSNLLNLSISFSAVPHSAARPSALRSLLSASKSGTAPSFRTHGNFRRIAAAYVLDHFRSFRIWPIVYDIILIGLRSVSVGHTALKPCISHAHPNSIIC